MRMVKTLLVSAFMSTVLSSAVFAAGTSYEVGDDVHNTNEVKFTSNGTSTEIIATSNLKGKNIFWRSVFVFAKFYLHGNDQKMYDKLKEVIEKEP